VADHGDRKGARHLAGVGHHAVDVVDDRLEVLDERTLAPGPAVADVVRRDDRRATVEERTCHVVVAVHVLPVAMHEHHQPVRVFPAPCPHRHVAARTGDRPPSLSLGHSGSVRVRGLRFVPIASPVAWPSTW
jgi:hypothetical protein